SKFDYSLFNKNSGDVFVTLLVYVDEIVITGHNMSEIENFKVFLKSKFQIKDLGKLKYFLAAKHVDTPLPKNTTLNHIKSDDDKLLSDIGNYQKLVGKLIYLTNTRPYISYVVHCLSQFMHAPLESHLDAALRVLIYLKGSPATRKSVSGYSAKVEYRSIASAICKVIWLSNLLSDMDVHLIREKVASGVIRTEKIHIIKQIADILTKALNIGQHIVLCEKLGLLDMFQVEKLEGGC
ncbi:ribonuclease H-like domain-containing protein, partial [Tanacetum coccineum]